MRCLCVVLLVTGVLATIPPSAQGSWSGTILYGGIQVIDNGTASTCCNNDYAFNLSPPYSGGFSRDPYLANGALTITETTLDSWATCGYCPDCGIYGGAFADSQYFSGVTVKDAAKQCYQGLWQAYDHAQGLGSSTFNAYPCTFVFNETTGVMFVDYLSCYASAVGGSAPACPDINRPSSCVEFFNMTTGVRFVVSQVARGNYVKGVTALSSSASTGGAAGGSHSSSSGAVAPSPLDELQGFWNGSTSSAAANLNSSRCCDNDYSYNPYFASQNLTTRYGGVSTNPTTGVGYLQVTGDTVDIWGVCRNCPACAFPPLGGALDLDAALFTNVVVKDAQRHCFSGLAKAYHRAAGVAASAFPVVNCTFVFDVTTGRVVIDTTMCYALSLSASTPDCPEVTRPNSCVEQQYSGPFLLLSRPVTAINVMRIASGNTGGGGPVSSSSLSTGGGAGGAESSSVSTGGGAGGATSSSSVSTGGGAGGAVSSSSVSTGGGAGGAVSSSSRRADSSSSLSTGNAGNTGGSSGVAPPVACVSGTSWSQSGVAPCAACQSCALGVLKACDPNSNTVCNAAEMKCGYISGDPHFLSLDGAYFDYQGLGDFSAIQSIGAGGISVQVRFQQCGTGVTCLYGISMAGVSLAYTSLTFPRTAKFYSNGVDITNTAPFTVGGVLFEVTSSNSFQITDTVHAITLTVYDYSWMSATICASTALYGQINGLMGTFDGNPSNDMIQRVGFVVQTGESWRVPAQDVVIQYPPNANYSSTNDPSFQGTVFDANFVPTQGAVTACAGLEGDLRTGCLRDVSATGDTNFATAATSFQTAYNEEVEQRSPPADDSSAAQFVPTAALLVSALAALLAAI